MVERLPVGLIPEEGIVRAAHGLDVVHVVRWSPTPTVTDPVLRSREEGFALPLPLGPIATLGGAGTVVGACSTSGVFPCTIGTVLP